MTTTAAAPPDHALPASGPVAALLREVAPLVRRRVAHYLPTGPCGDHLWDLLADYPRRGGKMLRSCLCVATARAFGADTDDALDCAAAIELLHNALLVHDDIEDDSNERRGAPTLHALHGIPLALNAGDALGLLCLRPMRAAAARLGPALSERLFDDAERTAWESAEGQALELGWQRDNRADLTEQDYLLMVLKKTCWLMSILPLRAGCLIGSRGARSPDVFVHLGFFFGAAFQIQDDLLNLEGGQAYGKEACGDLREGKRTLMLNHALRQATTVQRARLLRFLALPRAARSAKDVAWLLALMHSTGAVVHAQRVARGLAGAALVEFERAFAGVPDGLDRQFVQALVTWVLRRAA